MTKIKYSSFSRFLKKNYSIVYLLLKSIFNIKIYNSKLRMRENLNFPYSTNQKVHGYEKPFLKTTKGLGYFTRFYSTTFKNPSVLSSFSFLENFYIFFLEIFESKICENKLKIKSKRKNNLLVLSHFGPDKLKIQFSKGKKIQQDLFVDPERFSLINLKKSNYTFYSKEKFLYSTSFINKPIFKKKKITLVVFIDGFNYFDDLNFLKKKTPNIYKYFSKGTIFKNHHATSEWTLPSFASIFTSKFTHNHKIFHPDFNHIVSKENKLMPEFFQEKGYVTFQANGAKRSSPLYGYVKGFDRTVFKIDSDCKELIFETIEHLNTFKKYNNFVFLGLNEIHHFIKSTPSLKTQSILPPEILYGANKQKEKKSVEFAFDKNKIRILETQMAYLDQYLGILFEYLDKKKDTEVISTIIADHGHSFLSNDRFDLSDSKICAPWLLRGHGVDKKIAKEPTSNIDILPSLLHLAKIKNQNSFDGKLPISLGGKKKRESVFYESIFPGRTYKAVLKKNGKKTTLETVKKFDYQGKIDTYKLKFKQNTNDNNLEKKVRKILNSWNKKNRYFYFK